MSFNITSSNITVQKTWNPITANTDIVLIAGSSSNNVGSVILDFGNFPGKSDTFVDVTGLSGITSNSVVASWISPSSTADHSSDEHMLETLEVYARNITPGIGFRIYGINTSQLNGPKGRGTRIYGKWNVSWQWF